MTRPTPGIAIGIGGLVAGSLDIADAIIFSSFRGVTGDVVLKYIASGLLGPSAMAGGMGTATLGLALHFVIAFGAAAVFYAAATRLPFLWQRPLVSGPIFGLAVYLVMNFVVIPMSAIRPRPFQFNAGFVNLIVAHIFFVGLPIALAARRSARVR